jgi:hypothetical protein
MGLVVVEITVVGTVVGPVVVEGTVLLEEVAGSA